MMIVDLTETAKAEATIMSHWRSLPESMRGLDTRRKTREAPDPRLEDDQEHDDNDEGKPWVANGNLLLRSYLVALAGPDKADWSATGEQHLQRERELWKPVKDLLFRWLFLSDGPHACLTFLDDQPGGVVPGEGGTRDAQLLLWEKEALFNGLGPALLWSEPFVEERNNRDEEDEFSWAITTHEVPTVFARVCTRVLQAGDNEPVATALVESLGHIYRGSTHDAFQQALVAEGPKILACSNPAVVLAFFRHAMSKSVELEETTLMIERVVGELMDVHPDLRVKEAALRWLRHGSVPDSDLFRTRVLELAADSPTRIRVLALQVLPWVVGPELALEVVIETAFAAVMDNDIMVATEGCKVLGHYSVLNDEPASREIDAYAHRADLLVKTTVRRRPPVASLLALAAKCVAAHWEPALLQGALPAELHALVQDTSSAAQAQGSRLDELQKAAKATLLRLGGVIPALYDHVVPYVVSMLCPDHQWQLREGGLLVLGCMMRKWTELHSGYADLHLSVISSLTDPEARIRRRAAWVADASLRWLDEATQKEAISLLVPLLHDPDHKVQGAAYKALRRLHDLPRPRPRPVVKTIIEGCLNHLQHSALPWGCQDELTLLTLAHWIPDFVRGDDDVHDTDVVAGCMRVLLEAVAGLSKPSLSAMQAVNHVCASPGYRCVVDGEQLVIACERHFEATSAVFLAGLGALCSLLEHGLVSLEPDRATKWILFAVDTLQLNSLPGLSALYCFIKRYPECVTAQLSLVVPALMTRPLAYNLQESMYGFCMCIDALTTHCTEGVRAWVTSLSSFLVRHNYSMPQHMALRCCVQLAQCGAADLDPGVFALLTELNGGTLHAITASVSGIEHTFRPTTEGLANLLLESLAARKAHLAAPAFDLCAREIPSPQAALGLFMLFADHLQRRTRAYQRLQTSISQQQHTGADARGLPQVEENRCCPYGQDDSKELRDKVQRVLHELAARIGERLLREQKRRLQRHAGGLRRYLHTESPLLALLLEA